MMESYEELGGGGQLEELSTRTCINSTTVS